MVSNGSALVIATMPAVALHRRSPLTSSVLLTVATLTPTSVDRTRLPRGAYAVPLTRMSVATLRPMMSASWIMLDEAGSPRYTASRMIGAVRLRHFN